eukprot:c3598_g1_i1 orf=246-1568(+)
MEFHMKKDDSEEISPRGVLERSCLELDRSFTSSTEAENSSTRTNFISGPSNCDEEKTEFKLQQLNGSHLWKNLMARHLCICLVKYCLRCFSTCTFNLPMRSIPKLHKQRSMPSKAVKSKRTPFDTNTSPIALSWRCFGYEEIKHATNNFHPDNIVGKGGYAVVYKGTLSGGHVIAVKRLAHEGAADQSEKLFLQEIGNMGHIHHPNTAPLVGFCVEGGLYLVFHFYPQGSLASVLHVSGSKVLEWSIRYKVALGTAQGLHYLHHLCQHRIIHRDIKASNILLSSDFEPQISDFGLARWLPAQWDHHSVTRIEGTFGYLSPEYFMHGIVDEKTDVFAFGVLLLEIISGRRPINASQQSLTLWATPLLKAGNINALADPKLQGTYDVHQMQHMVLTAAMCINPLAISRPSMNQVLELLSEKYCSDSSSCWNLALCRFPHPED